MSSGMPYDKPGEMVPIDAPIASACRQYLEQAILTESPAQRTLFLFDLILDAARKGRTERVRQGIQELLDCLDFRYETAWNFQAFYEACLPLVEQGQLDEVHRMFQNLRKAWAQAFRLEDLTSVPTPWFQAPQRRSLDAQA